MRNYVLTAEAIRLFHLDEAEITHRYVIEIPALMDNATWEAEALEHEPDKLQ